MDQTTHEMRLANWKSIIEQCQSRPDGMSAKQWLRDNEIPEKQYYYWLRKLRKLAYDEVHSQDLVPAATEAQLPAVSFAEIPAETVLGPESGPAITIKTKKSTIQISSSVSESLMIQLVKAVAHAL